MHRYRNRKFIAPTILIIAMAVFSLATLETSIPTASYEIINDTEIVGSESIEITNSSFPSGSSVLLLNDSVLSEGNYWYKRSYSSFNSDYSRFSRMVTIPVLNLSEIILRVSAFIIEGPLNISMDYVQGWFNRASIIGHTGEYCEIVVHLSPEDYMTRINGPNQLSVGIGFEGLNWSVVDQLYFSIQVEFTDIQIPVTIDLQRTNAESMFLLPEFRMIKEKPKFRFGDYSFVLSQANDTIFLSNGNFTLSLNWWGYNENFNNVAVMNQSLHLVIRIKTVRLDVESIQNIPGLKIHVGNSWLDQLYSSLYEITDSPSFYLPPGSEIPIECEGGPGGHQSQDHFDFMLQSGLNRNISLIVSENWIFLGNIGFTPGRLLILFASLIILGLTIILARKEMATSSVFVPFILIFLGYIIPSVEVTRLIWPYPVTYDATAFTTTSDVVSVGSVTSISSWSGSATTIARAMDTFLIHWFQYYCFYYLS